MGKRIGIVVANDTHCGGATGLLPPAGAKTDEGNVILPNLFQEWAWERWVESWSRAQRLVQDADEVYVVLNGDLTDGWHHGTWEVLSLNLLIQARICREALSPMADLAPDKVFVVRGTGAHAGQQSINEEMVAEALKNVERCPETGNLTRWKFDAQILGHRVQAFHHGKLGNYAWSEQAALHRMAWGIRSEYDRVGAEPPDLVFVAHRHKWGDSGMFSCPTRVLMAPGWQGATSYVHRTVAGAGIVQVGMWVALLDEDVEPVVTPITFKPRVPVVQTLA